jgi:hypothetical protein
VVKEQGDFFLCDWKRTSGWLRKSCVNYPMNSYPKPPAPEPAPVEPAPAPANAAAATQPEATAEDPEDFVPRAIVSTRKRGTRTQYLVAWAGAEWADPKWDTWQSRTSIEHTAVYREYVAAIGK